MDKFVKHGITPFANAGNDYMAMQYLYMMELSQGHPAVGARTTSGTPGKVDFHDAAWTNAVNTFQDWVSKGYIAKNSVGLTATQAGNNFETGKSPMLMSGSWWAGTFETEIKNFQWGTFLWPGNTLNAGLGRQPVRGAEERREQGSRLRLHQRHAPARRAEAARQQRRGPDRGEHRRRDQPAQRRAHQELPDAGGHNGLAYYPDWPTPNFYNTLLAQTQDLMNGASGDPVLSIAADQLRPVRLTSLELTPVHGQHWRCTWTAAAASGAARGGNRAPPSAQRRRRHRGAGARRRTRERAVPDYLLPGAVLFTVVIALPLVMNIYISFTRWTGVGPRQWAASPTTGSSCTTRSSGRRCGTASRWSPRWR